jgi:hypothetical protein
MTMQVIYEKAYMAIFSHPLQHKNQLVFGKMMAE